MSRIALRIIIALTLITPARAEFRFKLHEIDRPGGTSYGQTTLADIDGDGDPDFVSGQRAGTVWWFEYQSPGKWVRHTIGPNARTDVGGVAFDVDGDGDIDQVSGGTLYLNPGKDKVRSQSFARHEINTISSHDNYVADIDGDGHLDLVAMSDQSGVFWYSVPDDPTNPWPSHRVGDARHSGIALGDIDGDGDVDIVRADWWFENKDAKGGEWITHENIPFPGRRYNFAGMATQARLGDIDGDGDLDIAMTDGEVAPAAAGWVENVDGKGGQWKLHTLAEGKGALHSMALADFDNDGDLDIFSCEMHIGGNQRWFIWENPGADKARDEAWKEHVILEDVQGHESRVADVDGDGDLDICSKPWRGDRHVFVENLLKSRAK